MASGTSFRVENPAFRVVESQKLFLIDIITV